jgi:hypothetical protein
VVQHSIVHSAQVHKYTGTHLRSKSPIPLTLFWVYWIISEKRNANAAAETSVVRVLFRFLSYMLGTGPPPTDVAIDERGPPSVRVLLLDAGRERRAAGPGGGVESEDRSPATPAGNEAVESTESRGWMAWACIVGSLVRWSKTIALYTTTTTTTTRISFCIFTAKYSNTVPLGRL